MRRFLTALAALLVFTLPALAQWGPNDATRFVGAWHADTGSMAGPCTVELRAGAGLFGGLGASSMMCLGSLGFLNGWTVGNGRIELLDLSGKPFGTLTADGNTLVGRLSDGSALRLTPKSGQVIARVSASPVGAGGCIVVYGTNRCADAADIAAPSSYPAQGKTLNLVNARAGLDPNSQVAYQIPAGQCFAIDSCYNTSVGLRCRIPAGDGLPEAYVTKLWPVNGATAILFTNRC